MNTIYYVDLAMCGSEFEGDVRDVAAYLSDHGWPAEAVTSSHNGAPHNEHEPSGSLWLDALAFAEGRLCADCDEAWEVQFDGANLCHKHADERAAALESK